MYFLINIEIPSLNEEWRFKAINTLQQKELCKVLLLNNNNALLHLLDKIIINCLDPVYDFTKLTILDKIVILLKLRCESIGDSLEIEVQKDGKKFNNTYNFFDVINKINKVCSSITPLYINEGIFKLTCNLPYIGNEINIVNIMSRENVTYTDVLPFFITNIEINDEKVILSAKDIEKLLAVLPASLYQKLVSHAKDILDNIHTIEIYSFFEEIVYLSFSSVYIDFLKFSFKEDLYGIHQEIYLLSKNAGFDSQYIENMPPLERQLYISFITQERQQHNASQQTTPTMSEIPDNNIDQYDTFMNTMGG